MIIMMMINMNYMMIMIQQGIANELAKLSIHALARLGGYLPSPDMTPDNPIVKEGLTAMMTPYLSKQVRTMTFSGFLFLFRFPFPVSSPFSSFLAILSCPFPFSVAYPFSDALFRFQ